MMKKEMFKVKQQSFKVLLHLKLIAMSPSFCNNENWNNHLTELSRGIFKFPDAESHNILYCKLKEMFNGNSKPPLLEFDFCYENIPGYRYIENDIPKPEYVGIDVPSYFNHSNEGDKKVIMIVGIDPKRNDYNFRSKISVGTPFGFNTSQGGTYWNFVQKLIENNFTVYLTDTFKLYFKNGNKQSYTIPQFTNPEIDIHQHIFAREIKIINPDLIVTLGHIPRRWFSSLEKGKFSFKKLTEISLDKSDPNHSLLYYAAEDRKIPILPLMHLSGRAVTKKRMLEDYGVENKTKLIDKYVDLINLRLKDDLPLYILAQVCRHVPGRLPFAGLREK
jgi:uracil-DNA glycosylase